MVAPLRSVRGAVDNRVRQLAPLDALAVQEVVPDVDVEQVRPVGATGVGGNDRDLAGNARALDPRPRG
jgi:hypothetical protein